ncbi:type IV secretory system conjugative DNA transfer family protein [Burkholderia sp. Ac-20345]|uniref:type IV secretory system conjugative DNA transfer family protein n=1 Tax=Burkholderia sp. Ac-20345 TaxID=2703891 RepID=UPI00197B5EB5|nr:type IV secretory system conjugative DNA transfer family protein [Burkholderia sp. Ac-20345]MBN3780524.1 type IV secretory system conjugative DNA transfer family protein [Burkholderia sp. Ac-20345]
MSPMAAAMSSAAGSAPTAIDHGTSRARDSHRDYKQRTRQFARPTRQAKRVPEVIIGKHRTGRYLLFKGQEFVILAAPTRGGKGIGMVVPNCVNYSDSLVVLDVKKENFMMTAGYRARHGQEVFLFAPFAKNGQTHRYNPLTYLSRDVIHRVGDVTDLGYILYPVPTKADPFWNANARMLFIGLVLMLMETPSLPCTLGEVFRQGRANGTGKHIRDYLQEIINARNEAGDPLSVDCVNALNDFMANSENTLSGILASFKTPLESWANPLVDLATSKDDFRLDEVRKKRMTIYIGVTPKQLSSAALLINVMFSQLVSLNTEELPEQNPDLKYQCLLLMDEFTSIGRVDIIAKAVSYMAGYNMRLLTIIQSISQLESVYGKDDARTFMTNHAVQVVFPPREQKDANEYSEMLGHFGMWQKSESRSKPMGSGTATQGESTSEQKRALVWPHEMKLMGLQDPPVQIIFYEKCRPILCNRAIWFKDDKLKKRVYDPVRNPGGGYPPPPVHVIDLDSLRAKLEGRLSELSANDFTPSGALALSLSALDIDVDDLPEAPQSESEADTVASATAFVDSFFTNFVLVEHSAPPAAAQTQPQAASAPAAAAAVETVAPAAAQPESQAASAAAEPAAVAAVAAVATTVAAASTAPAEESADDPAELSGVVDPDDLPASVEAIDPAESIDYDEYM